MSTPKLKQKPVTLDYLSEQQQALITISHLFAQAITDLSLYGKVHFKVDEFGSVEYKPMALILKEKEAVNPEEPNFNFENKKEVGNA